MGSLGYYPSADVFTKLNSLDWTLPLPKPSHGSSGREVVAFESSPRRKRSLVSHSNRGEWSNLTNLFKFYKLWENSLIRNHHLQWNQSCLKWEWTFFCSWQSASILVSHLNGRFDTQAALLPHQPALTVFWFHGIAPHRLSWPCVSPETLWY